MFEFEIYSAMAGNSFRVIHQQLQNRRHSQSLIAMADFSGLLPGNKNAPKKFLIPLFRSLCESGQEGRISELGHSIAQISRVVEECLAAASALQIAMALGSRSNLQLTSHDNDVKGTLLHCFLSLHGEGYSG